MDKMREDFEKWAKSECLDTDSVDGFYSDNDTHIAWGSWQAAQSAAVPVVGEVVAYDLSADYVKLLEFLKAGNDAAGFVTTDDYHNGDVVGITRRGPYNIHIGVRGYSFASVYPFNSEDGSEEEVFIKACEFSRLKWIKPPHSIPAAELDALRKDAAKVLHAEQIRIAAVAAIREVTGCPDIKGKDGAYLVDALIVNLLSAAPEPKK